MEPTGRSLPDDDGRYRLLVDAVVDYAIYMLDPDGIVTSWNPGAERCKGYTADEVIGTHFSRFYTEEDRAAGLPDHVLRTAATEGKFDAEGWRVRKDGTRFPAHVVIDPVRDATGTLVGFAKVTRDLTERRAAEAALREAEQALERTRETLFQSQKMEALGQLTGGVAHDFNNLLMAVLGSLELLKKRLPDDPRALRLLDNAVQGARRGAALTQRMLAFARRQELQLAPVDLHALVGGMTDLLERSIGPSVQIATSIPADLDRVIADSHQLELALLNLVMNARDAMPDGGRIVIAAEVRHGASPVGDRPGGPRVRLSVTDSGHGMDADTLARAMEPFFTTKGVGKGTGLGLSMVHGLAQQSGGWFALTSEPGRGTTAEIWLLVADADDPARTGEATAPLAAATPHVPRPLRIVAVDDDQLVLMNTTAMLEEMGHTVVEAASARDALRMLDGAAPIDLVVTDQAMPEMTGTQLIAAVRDRRPALPFVLVSGYAESPADIDVAIPRLKKPFLQRELASAITAAITAAAA